MDWEQMVPSKACDGAMVDRVFQRSGLGESKSWRVDRCLLPILTERELDPEGWRQEEVRGWVMGVRTSGDCLILESHIRPKDNQYGPGMGLVRLPREARAEDFSLCLPRQGAGLPGCCLEEAVMVQKNGQGTALMLAVHAVRPQLVPQLPFVAERYTRHRNLEKEALEPLGAWLESLKGFFILWGDSQGPVGWEKVANLAAAQGARFLAISGNYLEVAGEGRVALAQDLPVGVEEELRTAFSN